MDNMDNTQMTYGELLKLCSQKHAMMDLSPRNDEEFIENDNLPSIYLFEEPFESFKY